MIDFLAKYRGCLIAVAMAFLSVGAEAERASHGPVSIQFEPLADGGIRVVSVENKSGLKVNLMADGVRTVSVRKEREDVNLYAKDYVSYNVTKGSGGELWRYKEPKKPKKDEPKAVETEEQKTETPVGHSAASTQNPKKSKDRKAGKAQAPVNYVEALNRDPFFGQDAVNEYVETVNSLMDGLENAEDPAQFVLDNDLPGFLAVSRHELDEKSALVPVVAQELLGDSNSAGVNPTTVNLIVETLDMRLKFREEAFEKLHHAVQNVTSGTGNSKEKAGTLVNFGIISAVLLVVIVLIVLTLRRKKRMAQPSGSSVPATHAEDPANPAIVVRRRTTSILKRQCIDDVIDNPAYMVIEASEFTSDSAVRRIYVKNSCIKEVYNLYAEDLRNSENPKEDGCMVLGRWVRDESSGTYDISMEEVVLPGDDAVFKEYELNFGGKIKLRIAEKLRRLRRETNLQYDLVCWIHSHPGLGVFFSNSDVNVQMQLKHAQHPNFLTAFVVDILTSSQETGVFTFRKDGTMNSKGDLARMYSLEEMYKWALGSERLAFSPENCYNLLESAKIKMPTCKGVELNNSSIIDLTQIVVESGTGIVGWAVGTTIETASGTEFVVAGVSGGTQNPPAGAIGCLVSVSIMSIPTIQRILPRDCAGLSFVMVYSSRQMTLTTVPVINGELLTDEQFYGDVNIEELKIWTRRKR